MRRQRYLPFSRARMAPTGRRPGGRRAGFTLVEMMVAVVILSVGLLGLASTAGYVVRQVGGGAQQGIAANVIQSRVEWMRSIPCASIKESTTVTRGVTEHWVPGDSTNRVLAVLDTVKYSVMGSQADHSTGITTRVYTIMVPCW